MSFCFNIPHDARVRSDMLTKSVKESFGGKYKWVVELSDECIARRESRVISDEPPSIPNTETVHTKH